jgi:hypothetical protein
MSCSCRATVTACIGAYLQMGMPAFTGNIGTLAGVYRIPAMHVDVTAVYTNTNSIRPYRGNGRPEAAYIIERIIDLAADELGVDPVELRRRNYIPADAMPFKTALTFTYDCGEFEKNMDIALELADRFYAAGAPKRASAQAAASACPTPSASRCQRLRGGGDSLRQIEQRNAVRGQHQSRARPRNRVQTDRVRPARPRP